MSSAPALRRETFKTSRLAEFCSRRELVNQTGHPVEEWPFVILKELVDNSLDACEETHVAPMIDIVVSNEGVVISDNGPGLSPETVIDMLDYTSRVSSREAYVPPTRGAQGNALKTILAMPFALDGERGEILIESQGVAHQIVFTVDRIRQTPQIEHVRGPSTIRIGARVTVRWPNSACSILTRAEARFLQLAAHYAWVNPHLTLSVRWTAGTDTDPASVPRRLVFPATEITWHKWSPSDPTSPHWYDPERLGRLIGAKITHSEDRGRPCSTVREFIAEFKGLSGTAKGKAICDALGASRMSLAEFYNGGWSGPLRPGRGELND
jgi:DNA topoisomerase VI subunit B